MTVYMVFEPPRGGDDTVAHAERIVFVRDRFNWPAFLLGPRWLLWHRLWLGLVLYVVLTGALGVALRVLGAGGGGRGLATLLVALLLGFEGASLRRRKLLFRRWRDRGIVIGDDLEAAERRFFDRYVVAETTREMELALAAPRPPSPPPPASAPDVVGLFPQPGASPGTTR